MKKLESKRMENIQGGDMPAACAYLLGSIMKYQGSDVVIDFYLKNCVFDGGQYTS